MKNDVLYCCECGWFRRRLPGNGRKKQERPFEKRQNRGWYDKTGRDKPVKKEKDAVILAHYYVEPEVQEIADYVGDSFNLSKAAAGLPNKTLVFCGVSFMGESGKLLSPDKTVLMLMPGRIVPWPIWSEGKRWSRQGGSTRIWL